MDANDLPMTWVERRASQWSHGLDGAIRRLVSAHLCEAPEARFDARDREALAFLVRHVINASTVPTPPPTLREELPPSHNHKASMADAMFAEVSRLSLSSRASILADIVGPEWTLGAGALLRHLVHVAETVGVQQAAKDTLEELRFTFTCPQCGSHYFGTSTCGPKSEWTRECHGYWEDQTSGAQPCRYTEPYHR